MLLNLGQDSGGQVQLALPVHLGVIEVQMLGRAKQAGKDFFPVDFCPGLSEPVGAGMRRKLAFHQPAYIEMLICTGAQLVRAEHQHPLGKDPLGADQVAV